MAVRNYLVEGVSVSGKSSVCAELIRRGHNAVSGDKELAYQGDPETGNPVEGFTHQTHIWDVEKTLELINDKSDEVLFFCGGSRNFHKFIDEFDQVFILDVDSKTIKERLAARAEVSGSSWWNSKEQLELVLRLSETKEDLPADGVLIDATKPVEEVVEAILEYVQ